MADSTERLLFEIFAKDVNAERTFDKVGRGARRAGDDIEDLGDSAGGAAGEFDELGESAEKAGKKVKGSGDEISILEKRIDFTRAHLKGLIAEFDKTGDLKLFGDIKKDKSALAFLEALKKQAHDAVPKPTSFFDEFMSSGAVRVPGIAIGVVLASAIAAPLGAAIAGAVVGAVGLGGVIGGIALAAQDPRVKQEGAALGKAFFADLKGAASPFVGPLLAEFGELGEIGTSFSADLYRGFSKLAPLVKPLVEGLRGFTANLHIDKMFEAAQPAIRALAHELPEIGDALSDMFETLTKDDRATEGLIGLVQTTEDLIRVSGFLIGQLEAEYAAMVELGTAAHDLKETFDFLGYTGLAFGYFADSANDISEATEEAKNKTGDFNTTVVGLKGSMYDVANAADEAHTAMVDYAKGIEDQFDPMLNFIHRQQDVTEAQRDYAEAVKEHGRKSPEAKEANLQLAEAILAANSAAAKASGTFTGKLDPALRATLLAGGMTEEQLLGIEAAANAARSKLQKYEDNYVARVALEFSTYRSGERDPSGSAAKARNTPPSSKPKKKAAAGPVSMGNTYLVGDNGPELLHMATNAVMSGATAARAAVGASGGTVSVNVSVQPSTRARDLMGQLVLEMLRVDASFRSAVASYVTA